MPALNLTTFEPYTHPPSPTPSPSKLTTPSPVATIHARYATTTSSSFSNIDTQTLTIFYTITTILLFLLILFLLFLVFRLSGRLYNLIDKFSLLQKRFRELEGRTDSSVAWVVSREKEREREMQLLRRGRIQRKGGSGGSSSHTSSSTGGRYERMPGAMPNLPLSGIRGGSGMSSQGKSVHISSAAAAAIIQADEERRRALEMGWNVPVSIPDRAGDRGGILVDIDRSSVHHLRDETSQERIKEEEIIFNRKLQIPLVAEDAINEEEEEETKRKADQKTLIIPPVRKDSITTTNNICQQGPENGIEMKPLQEQTAKRTAGSPLPYQKPSVEEEIDAADAKRKRDSDFRFAGFDFATL